MYRLGLKIIYYVYRESRNTTGTMFRDRSRCRTNHLIGARVKHRDDIYTAVIIRAFYRCARVSRVVTLYIMFVKAKSYVRAQAGARAPLHDRSSDVTKDRRAGFLQSGFTSDQRRTTHARTYVRAHARTYARTHTRVHAQCYFAMATMMVIGSPRVTPDQPDIALVVLVPTCTGCLRIGGKRTHNFVSYERSEIYCR